MARGTRVWTAPPVQGGLFGGRPGLRCDCGGVSGLLARRGGRWPGWVARAGPERTNGLWRPCIPPGCPARRIARTPSPPHGASAPVAPTRGSGGGRQGAGRRWWPVGLAARHHGQRHGGKPLRLARQQRQQPGCGELCPWPGVAAHGRGRRTTARQRRHPRSSPLRRCHPGRAAGPGRHRPCRRRSGRRRAAGRRRNRSSAGWQAGREAGPAGNRWPPSRAAGSPRSAPRASRACGTARVRRWRAGGGACSRGRWGRHRAGPGAPRPGRRPARGRAAADQGRRLRARRQGLRQAPARQAAPAAAGSEPGSGPRAARRAQRHRGLAPSAGRRPGARRRAQKPSRSSRLRSTLRARRTASAASRARRSDGFS